jgi:tRNA G37 N-methylase Trm5
VAKLAGAVHVDASDVNYQAVECAKHNARINGLEDSINVFSSDLLQGFPQKKYDLIIANLPIVNFSAEKNACLPGRMDEKACSGQLICIVPEGARKEANKSTLKLLEKNAPQEVFI